MAKNYPLRNIKIKRSYSPLDIAKLFHVDVRTCLRWIREGLKPLEENVRPLLIMGSELKNFLAQQRKHRTCVLQSQEFYCLKCHAPVTAKLGTEKSQETGRRMGSKQSIQFIKTGVCENCSTSVGRFFTGLPKTLSDS